MEVTSDGGGDGWVEFKRWTYMEMEMEMEMQEIDADGDGGGECQWTLG